MMQVIAKCWRILRELAGDDAYERYRDHHMHAHAHEPLLDRRAFYIKDQQEKWNGVKRCC
ncbi:MAG TPA: CstA-like transporter-associated (seleno)protein [Steroidobacteraceae bacterium]|nr:CstA-like transporter-associated (seleno)protein [Steroidobacteraceae bacterium]